MSRLPLYTSIVASFAALSALARQQPQTDTTRYEIRGAVVDHLTSRPLSRVLVRLSPVTGPGQLTSITAEDGRFGFTGVPKGKYRLMAQRRGQFPHAFHETGQYSSAIVVGPGLDSTNIVFPLQAPASLSGVALDEDGEPIQGVNVILFREMVSDGEVRTVQTGNFQTNLLGQFHGGPFPAGNYYVAAQGPLHQVGLAARNSDTDLAYPLTFYGDTTDAQAARPLVLTEGIAAQIQLNLHSAPNIHVPLPPRRSGAEQVIPQLLQRGPGGSLIPINAIQVSGPQPQQLTGPIKAQSEMELTGFSAGRYLARIINSRPSQPSGVQEVDLADGIPWPPPEHSKAISLSGQLILENGQRPANNLQLAFGNPEDENTFFFIESKPDGSFTATDSSPLPGWHSIRLNSADYFIKSIAAKGARISGDKIELLEGSSPTLAITLAPAAMLSKLDGFALRDDKPTPGAMVLLVPSDLNRGLLFRRDQTDSDGSFTLPAIAPGKYTLLAIDDDGRGLLYKDPAVIRPYLTAGQAITFPLPSKEPVKITVQPRLP